MSILSKQSDYLKAYYALMSELMEPQLDGNAIDELLKDLQAALCTEQEEEGDEDEGYEDLYDFEPPHPALVDYLELRATLEDRAEDLTKFQMELGQDCLEEMTGYISEY